jgi:hypothetical protein
MENTIILMPGLVFQPVKTHYCGGAQWSVLEKKYQRLV